MLNNFEFNKLVDVLSDIVTARTLIDCGDCSTGMLRHYTDDMLALNFIGEKVHEELTMEYGELDAGVASVYKKLDDAIEKCYEIVRYNGHVNLGGTNEEV